jgi:outer membrane protein OmpA-like peptidoglycan-associated protein
VDRVLFPSGQATLTPEGRDVIRKVAYVFAAAPRAASSSRDIPDDVPIGPELRARFASNWELAAARATEVVHRLVERGMSPVTIEAVGRADTRPWPAMTRKRAAAVTGVSPSSFPDRRVTVGGGGVWRLAGKRHGVAARTSCRRQVRDEMG